MCAFALVAVFGNAQAQKSPPGALPEALKGIPPALGSCRPDDGPKSSPAVARRAEPAPDLACAISPSEITVPARDGTIFVDTRSAPDHASFRIDGALNLAVSELHGKTYLRGKRLVLIGDGKGERELYAACADLKRRGFKQVRVLRGGMASWLALGGAVIGRAPALDRMIRLNAAELWRESQFDANVVLVADKREAMLADLPFSTAVGQYSAQTIHAALAHRHGPRDKRPFASVVLVTDAEVSADEMLALQRGLEPAPLLVYTDTREALARYVTTQKAIWAAQARGPKQPNCGS